MALMKKLQPGGTLDENILNDAINQEIQSYNLKSKDERKVRDALVQFRDYMASPEGKSFSVDPVAQTFKISGPGAEIFQGSPDEIRSGWLSGKLKIKDNQDAMSIAASIYNNALSSSKKSSPVSTTQPSTEKGTLGIEELSDYALNRRFGGEKGFTYHYGQLKNDDEVKQFIYDSATDLLKGYKERFAKTPDAYKPENAANIAEVENAITSKNWEGFLNASTKLGWDPYSLLRTDEQKQAAAEKEKQATATAAVDLYKKSGLGENVQNYLYQQGFTQQANPNWTPDAGATWFKDVLARNKASVWYNPTTKKHTVVTPSGLFDYGMQDQFKPGYGFSWRNDQEGFHWYTPGQYSQNAGVWGEDKYGKENIGRELITNLPGAKVYGWSGQDESGIYAKDTLGRRDFTKSVQVEQNGHKYTLTKDDKGTYRDQQGRVVNLQIKGFGGTHSQITNYNDVLNNIPGAVTTGEKYDYQDDLIRLKDALSKNEVSKEGSLAEAAIALKWSLTNDPVVRNNPAKKQEIYNALLRYNALLEGTVLSNKRGGKLDKIKKAQKGMSFEEYKKRQESLKPGQGTNVSSNNPVKDITGTWKNESTFNKTMDALSIAGTVGSFVPVYGAIGAGVTLGADLAKDLQDGKIDNWGELGLNTAFVGLSAIGLGGVRSLLKVGKLAKTVKEGSDITKLATKASKLGLLTPELEAAVKISEKTGIKNTAELLKKAANLSDAELKTVKKGLEIADKIKSSSTPILGSVTLGKGLKDAGQLVSKVPEALTKATSSKIGKTVGKGLRIGMIGQGIAPAYNTLKTGFTEGWEYTKPEEIKQAAIAGSVGANWIKDIRGVKALERQVGGLKDAETKSIIKYDGKEYDVTGITKAKDSKKLIPWSKGTKTEEKNIKKLEEFQNEIKSKMESQGLKFEGTDDEIKAAKDKFEEFLKSVKPESITYKEGLKAGKLTLGHKPKTTTGDYAVDKRDYELAKKYLSENKIKYKTKYGSEEEIKEKAKEIRQFRNKLALDKKVGDKEFFKKYKNQEMYQHLKKLNKTKPKKENLTYEKGLSNLKSKIENYEEFINNIKFRKEGGVLKFAVPAGPLPEGISNAKVFNYDTNKNPNWNKPNDLNNYIPYGQFGNNDWRNTNGTYSNDYLNFVGNEENWNKYKNDIQTGIKNAGSNYVIKDYADYKRLATDNMPGPIHNVTMSMIQKMNPIPGKITGLTVAPVTIPTKLNLPEALRLPESNPNLNPNNGSGKTVQGKSKGSGNPFILPDLTEWAANKKAAILTDVANQKAGNEQRQAIANSMYTIPYQQQQYIRTTTPYSLLGEKEAGKIQSQANRIAAATSDIDKSIGVQLSGADKANEIRTKMGAADQERLDKTRMEQDAANARVSAENTQILGQNRANAAQAFQKVHLINANETLQRAANKVAETKGDLMFLQKLRDEEGRMKLFDFYNDPKYKALADDYNQWRSAENLQKVKDDYTKWYKNQPIDYTSANKEDFENSNMYKDYLSELKNKENKLTPWNNKAQQISLGRSLGIPTDRMNALLEYGYQPGQQLSYPNYSWMGLFKSGGSVTGADRIEMEKIKADSRKKIKELELFYKSILHDSEMLQKTLIKVFK